jgi:hypothetical protein
MRGNVRFTVQPSGRDFWTLGYCRSRVPARSAQVATPPDKCLPECNRGCVPDSGRLRQVSSQDSSSEEGAIGSTAATSFFVARHFNPVTLRAAQIGPSDGIEFRSLMLGHIFLHRAAHVPRHLHHAGNHRVGINLRAFGNADSAGFPQTASSPSSRHCGSESISPVVLSAAVVDSANGARNTSLPHIRVGSSSTKRHSKPIC